MIARQRRFLDGLVRRAQAQTRAKPDPLDLFRSRILPRGRALFDDIRRGAAQRYAAHDASARAWIEALAGCPSLLAPFAKGRDEVTQCAALAFVLELDDAVGRLARRRLAARVGLPDAVGRADWRVSTERSLAEGCRIDLWVEVDHRPVLAIEAKVDAEERDRQLADYRKHLPAHGEGVVLAFLTLDGREDRDGDADVCLSWWDVLAAMLPAVEVDAPSTAWLRAWLSSLAVDLYDLHVGPPGDDIRLHDLTRTVDLLDAATEEA